MERHDVGMVQGGDGPRLTLETRAALRIGGHPLGQDLQRNLATELRVLGLPDHTHPALADLLDQAVVVQLLAGFDGHLTALPVHFVKPKSTLELGLRLRTGWSDSEVFDRGPSTKWSLFGYSARPVRSIAALTLSLKSVGAIACLGGPTRTPSSAKATEGERAWD